MKTIEQIDAEIEATQAKLLRERDQLLDALRLACDDLEGVGECEITSDHRALIARNEARERGAFDMKLETKLRRYARMKRELVALEREIKQDAAAEARSQGLLMLPRMEVLLRRIAA
jgi:transposase